MSNIQSAGGLKPQPFQTNGKQDGGGNGGGGMFFGQDDQQQGQHIPYRYNPDLGIDAVPYQVPFLHTNSITPDTLKNAFAESLYDSLKPHHN